ncbi:MAG: GMC oxidoreductase [Pseudomonadota bacterium]
MDRLPCTATWCSACKHQLHSVSYDLAQVIDKIVASRTCRMGFEHLAVVLDTELRFPKIDGLRICDASIMPKMLSAKTMPRYPRSQKKPLI